MWFKLFATSAVVMLLMLLACQLEGAEGVVNRYPDWLQRLLGLIIILDTIAIVVSVFGAIWS